MMQQLGLPIISYIYYKVEESNGKIVSLKEFSSYKVILIVNVASNDGFTYSNYNELMDLHQRFHKHVSS